MLNANRLSVEPSSTDFVEGALAAAGTMPRALYVERHPFPFLWGTAALRRPHHPGPTMKERALPSRLDGEPGLQSASVELLLRPVHKVQRNFSSMITLGRTTNNDIVIHDLQISKFHAFFRVLADGSFELADAGSRFGTQVGATKLPARGPAHPLSLGAVCSFGALELSFIDSGTCWDRLRKLDGLRGRTFADAAVRIAR